MKKSIITVYLLLFLPLFSSAQDTLAAQEYLERAIDLQRKNKSIIAIPLLEKSLRIFQKSRNTRIEEISDVLLNLGNCYLDIGEYDSAIGLLIESLKIKLSISNSTSIKIGDCYTLIGIYYDYKAEYRKAIMNYEKALKIYNDKLNSDDSRIGSVYNNMGICISYQGDIKRACLYFEKAFVIIVKHYGINSNKSSNFLVNIGICYSKMKQYDKAFENFQKAKIIAEKANTLYTVTGARLFHSIGINYYETENFDFAIEYLKKALSISLKEVGNKHPEVGASYYALGLCYLEMNELSIAKDYFYKALRINQLKLGNEHPEVGLCLAGVGRTYIASGNYIKALINIDKALSIFKFQEMTSLKKDSLPDKNLLEILSIKANIHHLIYKVNKKETHLAKSNDIYRSLIQLIDKFRLSYKEERSKEILAEEFYSVYDRAIDVSYELFDLTKDSSYLNEAFRRCEKSSSLVLLEGLRNSKAKSNAGIPENILKKENQLKLDITFYEKEKHEEEIKEANDKDEQKIIQLNSQIFDLKQKHYQFIKNLEYKYPEYLNLKHDLGSVTIKELQKKLESDQTVVEYFLGENAVFIFVITKNKYFIKKIDKEFPLEDWVSTLRSRIVRFQFPFNLPETYHSELVETSHLLYLELIKPIEKALTSRLLIIPGDVLAYLPFESFVKEINAKPHEYKQHKYILNDYSIGYCYSATLLKEMLDQRTPKLEYNILAMAPAFGNDAKPFQVRSFNFSSLKHNLREAAAIVKLIGGELVYEKNATEQMFNMKSAKFNMIHLATHAKANEKEGEYSLLAFTEIVDTLENEWLYVTDIKNTDLNCDMVTLSACETGVGEIRKGEGVISLARSFSYAGAGCINTSLWKVSDSKTTDLMVLFYKQIKKGVSKDEAMRQAKLQFMKNYDDIEVHPFYWSPFISIGDMIGFDPSLFPPSYSWTWKLAGIFLITLFISIFMIPGLKNTILLRIFSSKNVIK